METIIFMLALSIVIMPIIGAILEARIWRRAMREAEEIERERAAWLASRDW